MRPIYRLICPLHALLSFDPESNASHWGAALYFPTCVICSHLKLLIEAISFEAISKKGFWFKFAAGPSFKPQAYLSISRI